MYDRVKVAQEERAKKIKQTKTESDLMNLLCPECHLPVDDELNKWWEISSNKDFDDVFYFDCPNCHIRLKVVVKSIPTFKITRTGT